MPHEDLGGRRASRDRDDDIVCSWPIGGGDDPGGCGEACGGEHGVTIGPI